MLDFHVGGLLSVVSVYVGMGDQIQLSIVSDSRPAGLEAKFGSYS